MGEQRKVEKFIQSLSEPKKHSYMEALVIDARDSYVNYLTNGANHSQTKYVTGKYFKPSAPTARTAVNWKFQTTPLVNNNTQNNHRRFLVKSQVVQHVYSEVKEPKLVTMTDKSSRTSRSPSRTSGPAR